MDVVYSVLHCAIKGKDAYLQEPLINMKRAVSGKMKWVREAACAKTESWKKQSLLQALAKKACIRTRVFGNMKIKKGFP